MLSLVQTELGERQESLKIELTARTVKARLAFTPAASGAVTLAEGESSSGVDGHRDTGKNSYRM